MDIDIKLHLGAHKTASTHLQQTLRKNSATLDAAGICYIPLTRLREIFTHNFGQAWRFGRGGDFGGRKKHILLSLRDELRRRETESGVRYRSLILSDYSKRAM